ncbi:response regulator transcription factor [Soonwooa sp.]|uniref:response regulator transcription factor n=1 Tax=Soonwooa sp. TaxID=1938592 RepID=UPI002632CD09|nr:response regulator transcription factor [Soonwooa sp.]
MIKKLSFLFILFFATHFAFGQKSEAYKMVGELFKIQFEQPDKAIEIGNEILNSQKATDLEQSYALIGIGTSYSIKGKPSKAIPFLTKAIEVAEKTDNYELRINSNLALANLYTKMNLHEESFHYIVKAKNEAKNEPNDTTRLFTEIRIATQLGQNLNLQEKYDESLKSLNEALALAKKYEQVNKKMVASLEFSIIYSAIGETLYNQKKWDESENAFIKVLEYSTTGENPKFERAFSNSYLGKIYYHRKEYQRAIDTLQVGAKVNDDKRSYIQADLYHTLSQAYEKLDDEKLSNQYNQLYLNEKSKISDEEKIALSESLKNEMRISQEQDEKKRVNYMVFGSIIVLLIGIGAYIVFRILRKKREDKVLFQKTIQKLEESIKEKEITEVELQSQVVKPKKTSSSATEFTENKLLQKLEKFENSEAYLNPKVSLSNMASQFDTNQSYVSELINTFRNKSFNQYINDLRIEYICRKIYEDSTYRNYKISHLAELSGYPSHTTFTKIFKKVTGISPSVFIANAKSIK